MMEIEQPFASRGWLTIWPKRPKPISSTLADRFSAASTPSIDGAAFGINRSCRMIMSGVSAIETMMVAVRMALASPSMMPTEAAAA
ncbi:hypothetical protein D3C80_1573650 [compost metagenome]